VEKVARYRDQRYWGKPVPNLLPPDPDEAHAARLLIVGLAPGAHGANRTGRMFTGDRSGDFLYAAMHRAWLCNQPESIHADDGLELIGTVITAAGHCAPPGNRPATEELRACSEYLDQTFNALPQLRAVLSLGGIAHRAVLGVYERRGVVDKLSGHPFAHGAVFRFDNVPALLCCYHPSQQNTFTGRLTPDMLLDVLIRARELAGIRV
jgi:uracil-DNA glycosylase family 4